ncbi:MAG: D-aminoacyl-tRNA deacylase [Armatimonadota bacterium]|nr:D-aminoacyl-tRNA deacylase [Armatimonadota bacterium]MDR7532379.1 D-aminoacyl-tRNA deacylase [Armatimonadota bacterium]MDR7535306.1 D-aminoacyl-tRNA deacylase [Armatimonadota bacterium]
MRAVVQRVMRGVARVGETPVGVIGRGVVVLLGVGDGDSPAEADAMADKLAHLRFFDDSAGKLNRSLLDVGGEVLLVPQFTLYGDTSRGRRPSFARAAPPERAAPLCARVAERLRAHGIRVATGRFGASMLVEIYNDGPVTLVLEVVPRARATPGTH